MEEMGKDQLNVEVVTDKAQSQPSHNQMPPSQSLSEYCMKASLHVSPCTHDDLKITMKESDHAVYPKKHVHPKN